MLYAQGFRRSEVAGLLGISVLTVSTHVVDITECLGVSGIVRAVVVALARGEIVMEGEQVLPSDSALRLLASVA